MIRCKHCNIDNLDTAKYCINCGKRLVDGITQNKEAEWRANHNEHKNSKKAKFCIYCGILLEGTVKLPQSPIGDRGNDKDGPEKWEPYLVTLKDYPNAGCIYKGEIKDGKPHGKGFIFGDDGSWWDGNFVDGQPNGFCIFYSAKNKHKDSGEYENANRVGKGKIEFENRVYEGEWNSNGAEGRGVVTFLTKNPDGSFTLTGEIQDGIFVESKFKRGKWTYPNGDYEEGSFDEDGLLHGIGSCYKIDNKRLDSGEYSHGERIGKGRMEWFDIGSILEGYWDDDGIIEGTLTTKKGKIYPYYNLYCLYKCLHRCLTEEHTAEELDMTVIRFLKKTNADNDTTTFDDRNLIKALIEYLYNEAPDDEQNVFMIAELINAGFNRAGYEEYESDLDMLFSLLEEKDENHIALQYYIDFFDVGGKQGNSIFETCRKRFSCIGSPDNIFQYTEDKDDAEMLAKVIIHSFSKDADSDDTDKLKVYLVELYENSVKAKQPVKYTDLNINMVEVEKLISFWKGCS